MTNEEKKAWLGRYRLAGAAVRRLQGELARWETQAAVLTARYGGASGRGSDDPLQRAVEEMLALRDELAEELQRQVALRREIEGAVQQVEDERLRELLRLRYIEGLTWEKVAERFDCSYMQTNRLHKKAISKLDLWKGANTNNKKLGEIQDGSVERLRGEFIPEVSAEKFDVKYRREN